MLEFVRDECERGAESMALQSTVGKLRGFRLSRLKLGVRGSLFAAFAVIAGMAIVISADYVIDRLAAGSLPRGGRHTGTLLGS